MGRIFETRKHTMFARWDRMAKAFTRVGKEIVIAVKAGGPDPDGNPQILIRCAFADFGRLQKALEDRGIKPISAESEYIPLTPVELAEDAAKDVLKLVDSLEQDDDVQKVFHTLA